MHCCGGETSAIARRGVFPLPPLLFFAAVAAFLPISSPPLPPPFFLSLLSLGDE